MVVNHAKQYERLRKIAWEAQSKAQTPTSIHFPLHIDTKETGYGNITYPHYLYLQRVRWKMW